jgi:AcrR family transcriptional regulator
MTEVATLTPAQKRILEFAFLAFGQKGFKSVVIDSIAKELHVSKKTIYKHFSTKEELLERSVSHQLQLNEEKLALIEETVSGGFESFQKLCQFYISFQVLFPPSLRAEFALDVPHLEERIHLFENHSVRKKISRFLKLLRNANLVDYPSPTRELVDAWCISLNGLSAVDAAYTTFIIRAFFKGISVKPKKKKKNK